MIRGVMPMTTFSVVMDAIRRHLDSVKVVVLYHGGEPLLNKNFATMARTVKAAGIPFVKTVTNGMLFRDHELEGIIASGIDAVEFSLDGTSAAQNNAIRRNCDYDTVVSNVKRLIDAKQARGLSNPQVFISSTQFLDKATYTEGQTALVPHNLKAEFGGAYEREIAEFKCTFAMRWPRMEVDEDLYEVYFDPYDHETLNHCDHVDSTISVRWNGDVVACCYDLTSEYVLGNVLRDDLEAIWNGPKYLHLRESIDRKEFVDLCNNCNVVRPNVYLTLRQDAPTSDR
jgi:radical SAM protein with 4Fe4S-binding SPASM domain